MFLRKITQLPLQLPSCHIQEPVISWLFFLISEFRPSQTTRGECTAVSFWVRFPCVRDGFLNQRRWPPLNLSSCRSCWRRPSLLPCPLAALWAFHVLSRPMIQPLDWCATMSLACVRMFGMPLSSGMNQSLRSMEPWVMLPSAVRLMSALRLSITPSESPWPLAAPLLESLWCMPLPGLLCHIPPAPRRTSCQCITCRRFLTASPMWRPGVAPWLRSGCLTRPRPPTWLWWHHLMSARSLMWNGADLARMPRASSRIFVIFSCTTLLMSLEAKLAWWFRAPIKPECWCRDQGQLNRDVLLAQWKIWKFTKIENIEDYNQS